MIIKIISVFLCTLFILAVIYLTAMISVKLFGWGCFDNKELVKGKESERYISKLLY